MVDSLLLMNLIMDLKNPFPTRQNKEKIRISQIRDLLIYFKKKEEEE